MEERLMLVLSKASLSMLKSVFVKEVFCVDLKLDIQERVFNTHYKDVGVIFHCFISLVIFINRIS